MKLLLLTAAIVMVSNALSDEYQWQEFKRSHSKSYRSLDEEKKRFNIFQSNLRLIEAHNEQYARGEVTYKAGITVFTDITEEEFQSSLIPHKPEISGARSAVFSDDDFIPESVNWTEKGAVIEPKKQGFCGCCWAFAATGAVEARVFIKTGKLTELSVQNLIDCTRPYGNHGCNGGYYNRAFAYIVDNGILTEKEYPFKPFYIWRRKCEMRGGIHIKSYVNVTNNATAMKISVAKTGPICAAINTSFKFLFYKSGILDNSGCRNDFRSLNHDILIVGYGVTENGEQYWICKNSSGMKWGENGYFRLKRGDDNACGVNHKPIYPVL